MRYRYSVPVLIKLLFIILTIGSFSISEGDQVIAADAKTKAAQEALITLGYDPGAPDGA